MRASIQITYICQGYNIRPECINERTRQTVDAYLGWTTVGDLLICNIPEGWGYVRERGEMFLLCADCIKALAGK